MRIRPQDGEEQPGATPLSANYKDQIEQMVQQLANKAGKFTTGGGEPTMAGSVMGGTRDRLANTVAGYLKMFAPDPTDPTSMLPIGGIVRNPLNKVSILGKQISPKMYKRLDDRKDVDYWFRENKKMTEGSGGYTRVNPRGDKAIIAISPQSYEHLSRAITKKKPPVGSTVSEQYFGQTALPHEMIHGVNVFPTETPRMVQRKVTKGENKFGTKRSIQGMPLGKQFRIQDDALVKSQGRVGKRIEAQMDAPSRPGQKSRIDPNVLEWSQGYAPALQADEALVQQAAANVIRHGGVVDKQTFMALEQMLNRRAQSRERNMTAIRDLLRSMGELE